MSDSARRLSEAQRRDLVRGARDILPVMVATVPFGIVFGAISAHEGMSFSDSVLISALTFAGASQFAALEFWAYPFPVLTILLSVMAVNLRIFLYSAALGRRISHWPAPARYAGLALLNDPTYALAEMNGGPRLSPSYYFGLSIPLYINWVVTTAAGYLFGNLISRPEVVGLDFVVVAYFIHLLAGFRSRPNSLAVIGASAAGSVLAFLTLGSPWHFAGGALAGIGTAVLLARPRDANA